MLNILFSVVRSRQGGAGKSRKRGRSEQTTPLILGYRRASNSRRHPGRRRTSSDTMMNDVADGDSGFQRTDIKRANSSKMASDDIPEWLVLNILIRLPSKFVVRCCKLVCKKWASLISDPFFVRSYLSHSSSSPTWTVIEERVRHIDPRNVRFLEYNVRRDKYTNSRQYLGKLSLPTAHEDNESESFKVFGASNGLILFGLKCDDSFTCSLFYICNPVTRKLVSLSPLPQEYLAFKWRDAGSGFIALVENAVLESFRVVLLVHDTKTGRLLFIVYAYETREWSEFVFPGDKSNEDILEKNPTAHNGILHWETQGGSIITYDPYEKPSRIRVIAPPKDADSRDEANEFELRSRCLINASVGKLRYFERSIVTANEDRLAVRLRIWVLEDGGVWRMSHESDDTSILVGDYSLPRPVLSSLTPMFLNPFDSDIVYLVLLGHLLKYDFWSGKFEIVKDSEERGAFVLELSPWPISITPLS